MYAIAALGIFFFIVFLALAALASSAWAYAKGREPFLNYRGIALILCFLVISALWRGNFELPATPGAVTATLVFAYIWAGGAFLTMGYLALRLLITEDTNDTQAEKFTGYAKSIGLVVAATGFALSIVSQRAADAQLNEIATLVQIDQLRTEEKEVQLQMTAEAKKLDETCTKAQIVLTEVERIETLAADDAQFSWLSINESGKDALTEQLNQRLQVCAGSRSSDSEMLVSINGCVVKNSEDESVSHQPCEVQDRAAVETLATWKSLVNSAATKREEISTLTISVRSTPNRDAESVRRKITRNAFLSTFLLPMITFGGIGLEFAFLFIGAPRRRNPNQPDQVEGDLGSEQQNRPDPESDEVQI
ncbi:hypothetical protein [Ruegeria sp. HKCCD8929]|uniref:hypothetical protein n=1 Tax=Ruegeria sp. HKCCD8929 TaxID=2683006 RepID=UPI001488E0AB|nr:hypothetical protein [Ruegeria sp. HKCCD8929]